MNELYIQLDQFLKSQGFLVSNISDDIYAYNKMIKISTPPQLMVINGAPHEIPGKVGDINIILEISKNNKCLDNDEDLMGVFLKANFKDVTFKQYHFLDNDISTIMNEIKNFVEIFGWRIF